MLKTPRGQAYPGRLNLFQRMMLRWRELHPYNAVHVAQVARPLDALAVRRMIAATLEAQGISAYALDPRRRRFVYRGGAADPELAVPARPAATAGGDADSDRVLADEIERQLNRPFALGEPMRFFAIPAQDGYLLGIAYDHFIAGGDSIASLLGAIIAAITGAHSPPVLPSLYPPTYRTLLRRHAGWFVTALATMPALARESKTTLRPADRDPDDPRNAYALVRIAPTETAALRAHARAFDVTLHDLVVALLLRTLSPLTLARRRDRQRRNIGVASIVNIRRDFDADCAKAFGQLLASMRVTHAVGDDIGVDELARDVRRATRPIKRSHLYLRTLFGLAAASVAWRFLSPAQRRRFYAKHHPASAGISMLDVDPCWPAGIGAAQSYTRGVSTGPLTPAVLAISTTATAMSIGVSWRAAALPADFAMRLQAEIRQCASRQYS